MNYSGGSRHIRIENRPQNVRNKQKSQRDKVAKAQPLSLEEKILWYQKIITEDLNYFSRTANP